MVYISGKCKREARIAGAGIAGQRMMNVALRVRNSYRHETRRREMSEASLPAWAPGKRQAEAV